MQPQDTSTRTSTSTDISALVTRLEALDVELAEHMRSLRYVADDIGATLESQRQVRVQVVALLGRQDGAR